MKIRMTGKHGLTRNEALALLEAAGAVLGGKPPRYLRQAEQKLALAIAAFNSAPQRAVPGGFTAAQHRFTKGAGARQAAE